MELCHCTHRQNKLRCSHLDFCLHIAGLETSNATLLKDYTDACDEAEKYSSRYESTTLKVRDQQATITELEGKVKRHLEIYHNQRKSMGKDLDRIEELEATITELTGLLRAAACPYCDGSGSYYDNMGEVRQCQWCDETLAALKEVDGE